MKLHVDGSSNSKGSGEGLILENSEGLMIEVSLSFAFTTSNNQAEYEACIAGLKLVLDFGARTIELNTDSFLVVSQVNKDFMANDPVSQRYLARVRELLLHFEQVELKHVPRAENGRADILAKMASMKPSGNLWSIIHENLKKPSVDLSLTSLSKVNVVTTGARWIQPIKDYIEAGVEPADTKEAAVV